MKIHQPIYYISKKGNRVYYKKEINDEFLFRKTNSISVNARHLESCDIVCIELGHLETIVWLEQERIKKIGEYKTFKSSQTGEFETKIYVHIDHWHVTKGDINWTSNY